MLAEDLWHRPRPGPEYWWWRCLVCGQEVQRHPGPLQRARHYYGLATPSARRYLWCIPWFVAGILALTVSFITQSTFAQLTGIYLGAVGYVKFCWARHRDSDRRDRNEPG